MNMILHKNIFRLIDRLIFASHELFVRSWGFLYVRDAEHRVDGLARKISTRGKPVWPLTSGGASAWTQDLRIASPSLKSAWPCCLLYYASFSTSLLVLHYQWWIQGRPPRSFLDQTGAGRAKNVFSGDQAPPPYLRLWITRLLSPPPPPPLISMSGSVTDYRLCVRKTYRYYCVGDLNNPKSITFKSCYLVALEWYVIQQLSLPGKSQIFFIY